MAFTHALYFPWIDTGDIENQEWLKTSILYWDKLSTIVPASFGCSPYKSDEAKFLQLEGFLVPEYVDPYSSIVDEASKNFLAYMNSSETERILLSDGVNVCCIPPIDEASSLASIQTAKMSKELVVELIKSGKVQQKNDSLIFDSRSAIYYMTLLAASISRYKNYSPVTDDPTIESLANRVRRGDRPEKSIKQLGEGLLAKITMDSVGIAKDTSFKDIIDFREEFKDELGAFRTKIGELGKNIDVEIPSIEALEQQVNDIYHNEIAPAVNILRKAIKRSRVRSSVTQLTTVVFASSVPLFLKETPVSLLAGATIQLIMQGIKYELDRREQLAQDPFSYILKVEKHLS